MGVLRGALQSGVFRWRDGGFERRADRMPVRAEFVLARTAETVLCQFRRAETDEAQQVFLFIRRRCAARLLKRFRQSDRGDVVTRTRGPAAGKRAVASEMKVVAVPDGISRRGRSVTV